MEHDCSQSALTAQVSKVFSCKKRENYTPGYSKSVTQIVSVDTNKHCMAYKQPCKTATIVPNFLETSTLPSFGGQECHFALCPLRKQCTLFFRPLPPLTSLFFIPNLCFLCDHHRVITKSVSLQWVFLRPTYNVYLQTCCLSEWGTLHRHKANPGER